MTISAEAAEAHLAMVARVNESAEANERERAKYLPPPRADVEAEVVRLRADNEYLRGELSGVREALARCRKGLA